VSSRDKAGRASDGARPDAAAQFERCVRIGGVAVFPSDTVYGLACDPGNAFAVERIHLLKRRSRQKPSAVMFFDLELALDSLPELGPRTRAAIARLLPGPVGFLLPNPAGRFALASGEDLSTLGLRVPAVSAFAEVPVPVLQSSANRAGGPDPHTLAEVPELLRAGADLVLDGGELPGTPSTVVDLRRYELDGSWSISRAGAVSEQALAEAL
jgi:L-threonylcarbamoyladenylate synthase